MLAKSALMTANRLRPGQFVYAIQRQPFNGSALADDFQRDMEGLQPR